MRRMVLMLGLLALAACGAPPEPENGPAPAPAVDRPVVLDVSGAGTPSIYGLIGERQRLGLTGAQVTTLDSLAQRLAAANDSLRRALGEDDDRDRPRPGTPRWDRAQAALQTIGRNNRAAGLLVQSVLTDDQRRIACEMQAEQRARRPAREGRPTPGSRRPGGRVGMEAGAPGGWPWCTAPAPPAARP